MQSGKLGLHLFPAVGPFPGELDSTSSIYHDFWDMEMTAQCI